MARLGHNFAGAGDVRAASVRVNGVDIRIPLADTNAELEELTGLSPVMGWRLDRVAAATGTVASIGAAATLTIAGTIVQAKPLGAHDGVHFSTGGGKIEADVCDSAAESFLAVGRASLFDDPSGITHEVMGRHTTAAAIGWSIQFDDTGALKYWIEDGIGGGQVGTILAAAAPIGRSPVDFGIQVDRGAGGPGTVGRFIVARNGAQIGATLEVALANLGTLFSALSQPFGFGTVALTWSEGAWVGGMPIWAKGTQTEGATKLADTMRRMGLIA